MAAAPISIGISSCLLGQKVRYDGGHKRDEFIVDTLGRYVEWVPVCPELEMGLGVPREPIHLIANDSPDARRFRPSRRDAPIRLVGVKSGVDHTAAMEKYAKRRLDALEKMDLCGYILKKDSPSCGLFRVKVW